MPVATPRIRFTEQYLMRSMRRPSAARAKGVALAAVRETFEETGLILGYHGTGQCRRRMACGRFAKAGSIRTCRRCISLLVPSRRHGAAPPLWHPLFAVDAATIVFDKVDNVVDPDAELVELVLDADLEGAVASTCPPSPALCCRSWRRASAGFGHDRPVPFYRMPARYSSAT